MHFFLCLLLAALIPLAGCDKKFRSTIGLVDRPGSAVVPPSLSEVFASAITTDGATVMWRTNKPADSKVKYGETEALWTETASAVAVVEHAIVLSRLKPATKYFFTVTSKDSLGQEVSSVTQEFTTESVTGDTAGPATASVSASPNPTAGATLVGLSAAVSDLSTGGRNVTGAEYFIDVQGAPGAGTAMTAQDGSFNAAAENVNVTVNAAGLSQGNHTIYVRGRDAGGNWGAFASVSLSVTAGSGTDTNGPLVSDLSVTPNPTSGAGSVTVAALISDAGTGNANVAAAEYFTGAQGANGTGTSLNAQDGSFNSPTENVARSVSVAGLGQGTHRVYVHGRDANGNWGGFQFIDLSVTSAVTKPDAASTTAVSYSLSFSGNRPQEAIWIEDEAGNFVRTLFVSNYTSSHLNTLPTWNSKAAGRTDGTTGATKAAGSFNANWGCRDTANTLVAAGNYRYRIEVRQQGGNPSVFTGTVPLGNVPAGTNGTSGSFVTSFSANYTP